MYNDGEYYTFDPEGTNYGMLLETPCSGYENFGQFDAMVEKGDVLAIFTGHDHTNAFGVKHKGIDIINSLSTRYNGDRFSTQYGYRVIEIDEADTSVYTTLATERAEIIMQDLNKFSGEAGIARLIQAKSDYANGVLYFYENADEEMRKAKALPNESKAEKEIRSDAIKNVRAKKESAFLIKKYGIENITAPDESVKEELRNRETTGFIENMKVRRELRAHLKDVSVYERVVKPYTSAKNLLEQAENYTHYEELEERYVALK